MAEGKSERKSTAHTEAELRDVVRGIVSEVVEQKEQERVKAEARAAKRANKVTVLLSLALLTLVAWIAFSTLLPAVSKVRVMPDELLGFWSTADERYANRALEIQKSSLVFHTGDGGYTTHPIQQVSKVESDTLTLYEIDYLQDDVVFTLSFFYEPAPVDKIRFENQREIEWSR